MGPKLALTLQDEMDSGVMIMKVYTIHQITKIGMSTLDVYIYIYMFVCVCVCVRVCFYLQKITICGRILLQEIE